MEEARSRQTHLTFVFSVEPAPGYVFTGVEAAQVYGW